MKLQNLIRVLFLLALSLSFPTRGSASSLPGKVVEVLDGERIILLSLNRPMKIKLIGVAAPAAGQPYEDIARQHLSSLILDKFVVVRYTSLRSDGYLVGQVMLNDMDIGEQVIRDGTAWYDKSEGSNLAEQNRAEYLGCEQAARGEGRGLWQDPAPLSPWEFRRQEAAGRNMISSRQAVLSRSSHAGGALNSGDLFRSMTSGPAGARNRFSDGTDSGWKTLAPKGGKFSVLVPGDALDYGATVPTQNGKTADVNYCLGRRGRNSYLVIWAKGPSDGMSDEQVGDDTANGLAYDFDRSLKQAGSHLNFEVKRQRSLRMGNYSGWQYSISAPGMPGMLRVFSRRNGQEREVFVIGVMNAGDDDPQVQQFLNSFTIGKY
jgi:micrococcal nuclease